jgi:hypothetical protein
LRTAAREPCRSRHSGRPSSLELGRSGPAWASLTTRGVQLKDLVTRTFWIGAVLARGTRLCSPVSTLSTLPTSRGPALERRDPYW